MSTEQDKQTGPKFSLRFTRGGREWVEIPSLTAHIPSVYVGGGNIQ